MSKEGKTIFEFEKGPGEKVRITLCQWEETHYVDVRIWYRDGDNLKPTRKGIRIHEESLPDLITGLRKVVAELG